MDKPFAEIYQALQKLIGLHRQLMENVRLEREALVAADLTSIQGCTVAKQGLIEAIRQTETQRQRAMGDLALLWKRPVKELSLGKIIVELQGKDLDAAEKFRSSLNTLTVLIEHITDQNGSNRSLVEKSLEHVDAMKKKNILGETVPRSNTYNPSGQRSGGPSGARLISKEV